MDSSYGGTKMTIRLSEKAMYTTVKLTVEKSESNEIATGFIFKYFRNEKDSLPVIVTNTHVIKDWKRISFFLNRGDEDNRPIHGDPIIFTIENESKHIWVFDDKVDLAIMPFGRLIQQKLVEKNIPFYTGIDSTTIPSREEWERYHALEDILVIGYPNGLSDELNNLQIFIKGNTSTHPNFNYYGREEFLINANTYPGSSGSPVFLLDDNFYAKSREYQDGRDKARLLGILYAGYDYNVRKSSEVCNAISSTHMSSCIPMNICNVIKSTKLLDFEPILREELASLTDK
jgi:V8-like Glu-specific endopeptidase